MRKKSAIGMQGTPTFALRLAGLLGSRRGFEAEAACLPAHAI